MLICSSESSTLQVSSLQRSRSLKPTCHLPQIPGMGEGNQIVRDLSKKKGGIFEMSYPEGIAVGYKWFELKHRAPLFAFGHGLSYTTFAYSGLKVDTTSKSVEFTITNTGRLVGAEIAQLYCDIATSLR